MYLSGAPLHVITLSLVERVRRARPRGAALLLGRRRQPQLRRLRGPRPGAGDRLHRPAQAGRLRPAAEVPREPRGADARAGRATVGDYVVKACGRARRRSPARPASPLREALLASLRSDRVDLRRSWRGQEAATTSWCGRRRCSTRRSSSRGRRPTRYRAESLRPPRRIGRHLALFDCINCDKCLPACPNDANFVYEVEPLAREYESYRVEGGHAVPVAGRAGSRCASATRSGPSRTSATTAATATRSAPRTAGRTSRSRASSARSRPGGSRRTRDGFFVEVAPGTRRDVGAPRRRRVPPRGGPGGGPGRLHGRARDARAAPPRAHAGRRVGRARHARRPHARRRRLPEDGACCSTASSTRAAPTP